MFDTDLDLKNYVIARFAERPHLSATQFKALIELPRPEGLGRVVALRTLQLFLAPLRKSAMAKALVDPDKYRSHHKPAFGSLSQNVVRINQKWEIDASPADVMCLENGSPVRKKLMALIDVFTRRAVVLVVDQPSGNGTKALLRRAMLQWGMPELVKADNGKEFKNLAVERFCRDAGIALELSRKFSPEEKGHIERFFETLSHGLLPLLPGFIGHDVAMRKGIENRKSFAHRFGEDAEVRFEVELSPEGLQARIDAWLRDVYEQNHHGGLALRPCDKALAHAGDVRRIGDERDLDALMLVAPDAHGIRIVRKKGIAIANRHYVAPELGGLMGERVQCRFDPFDPSRIAVFTADASRFLCVAEDPAVIAPDRMVRIAKEAQAIDRSRIRAIRDGARKVLQLHPGNVGDALLTNAAGNGFIPLDDSARDAMRFAQAPRLVAAREGFDAIDDAKLPPQPIPVSEDAAAAARDVMAELEARNTKPAVRMLQCDGYERPAFENDVEFWRWAKDWRAQGRELDAQDKSDIADLSLSPAFAAMLANDDARRAHTA
jgi:transposase InsO family protein